jgi:hypothetical protein
MWIENEYYQNEEYINTIKENVFTYQNKKKFSSIDYIQDQLSAYKIKKVSFLYTKACKELIRRFPQEILKKITGYYKKNQGYKFLGWYRPIFMRPYFFKYFQRIGKKPEELTGYKLIYFPLHLEPEIALLSISPEFNNSMELITWISKSLPADALLVVKENPLSFGIRSKQYYDNLRRINNVVLSYPDISSWQWIRSSNITATISGTAGIESVYFERPVISFGKHQIINHLPTVRYVYNYDTTRDAISELLSLSHNDKMFKISKEALYHAQMKVSFEMPGIEKIIKDYNLHMNLAEIAYKKLREQYMI